MLSGDVLKLVLLAFVFSAPLTWYLMQQWLENYSYHIPLNVGYLAAGLVITMLIAVLTMSYRTYKAAAANPALSLRSE
jgi:putative ABC transport system permease protein